MGQRERLFAKVCEGRRNVRFEALVRLMELWGFEARYNSAGDGVSFRHGQYAIIVTAAKPHHGPVKPVYVRGCIGAIEEAQLREANSDA